MIKTLCYQRLAISWAIFILIICNVPISSGGADSPFIFEGFDKLVHTGLFFVLTILLFFGKIKQPLRDQYSLQIIFKIMLLTAILGGAIECLQWKVFTYRSAEWWDFFADMLGVGMGIFGYIFLHQAKAGVLCE